MKRKPLSKVPIYAREAYNKALSSAVADPGYAMETLRDLVKSIPDFGVASSRRSKTPSQRWRCAKGRLPNVSTIR